MNMTIDEIKKAIEDGNTAFGMELGSTRIKSVLVGPDNEPIASGSHEWENSYIDNIWTYSIDEIWKGVQSSYQDLANDVKDKYGLTLKKVGSMGFSAMMHGYMAFDKDDNLLVPFRTWRNTITGQASKELTDLFDYHILLFQIQQLLIVRFFLLKLNLLTVSFSNS